MADNDKHFRIQELEAEVIRLRQEICDLRTELQSLRSFQEQFSQAFHNHPIPMTISRLEDGLYKEVNESYLSAVGFNREEVIGKTALELGIWLDPKDRQNMTEQLLKTGHVQNYEYKYRNKSGDNVIIALASFSILDINGEKYLLTSVADITERKKLEEALLLSEEKFSKAFYDNQITMAISTLEDGVYNEVNQSSLDLFGFNRGEVIGKSSLELGIWADLRERENMFEQLVKKGHIPNFEYKFRKKTGDIGIALGSFSILDINGEKFVLTSAVDITEMRRIQNEMSRLENLNIVGQMAASIAHEVRNPMTSIRGFLQFFQSQDIYSKDKEAIELMIEELDRVNEIISGFLSLAQTKNNNLNLYSLKNEIIALLPMLIADAMKNGILIKTELQDVAQVNMGEGEIRQLLLNIVRNGIEAMSEGGTITLKTFDDNKGVNLLIEDEGHGIPPEVLEKIGTPFFTTKKTGTGLGLAVCYRIAERHNAEIDINTSPEGTVFKVIFPFPERDRRA